MESYTDGTQAKAFITINGKGYELAMKKAPVYDIPDCVFDIIDVDDGHVVSTYKNGKTAHRRADKLNNDYGRYKYAVKRIDKKEGK